MSACAGADGGHDVAARQRIRAGQYPQYLVRLGDGRGRQYGRLQLFQGRGPPSDQIDRAALRPARLCHHAQLLHPAFVDTPLLDGFSRGGARDDLVEKLARQIPVGRIGRPEEVPEAALCLCSDAAQFVTGAELVIDGGLSAM